MEPFLRIQFYLKIITGAPYDFRKIFNRYSAEHLWKLTKAKLSDSGHIVPEKLESIFTMPHTWCPAKKYIQLWRSISIIFFQQKS